MFLVHQIKLNKLKWGLKPHFSSILYLDMKVSLKKNLIKKEVPVGFSWTVTFFGGFVPLFRGDLKWFFIMILLGTITLGLSKFFFIFCYNKIYIKELLADGWVPATEEDKALLIKFDIINDNLNNIVM